MATLDGYRVALFSAVEAAKAGFSAFPVVIRYQNQTSTDVSELEHPFLDVELIYNVGRQADISNKPWHRLAGFLVLTAKDREGAGTQKPNQLLEHFYPKLHMRGIGGVQLEMSDIKTPPVRGGLYSVSAMIPFTINKMS